MTRPSLLLFLLLCCTLLLNAQEKPKKEKRGISVGAFSGIYIPTGDNRILGELYSLGIYGEARFKKNGYGVNFGYLGKNNIPTSINFFATQDNANFSLNKLTGMTISFDYSRELLEVNPIFFEGILSAGYSELKYKFDTIDPIQKPSFLFSPGIMTRWVIYESGSGALHARLKIQYNFVNLALKESQVNRGTSGNYFSLNLTLGLATY